MKNSIPQYQTELPGTIWGLTVYYNPAQYKTKLQNYMRFRESSKRQGLNLLCVELAFGNAEFELQEWDADILIQRRGISILWQKERLFNLGLEQIPDDCDKIVWLDADIIFCNDHWIDETCHLLGIYNVIQPFSFCIFLSKGVYSVNSDKLPLGNREGDKLYGIGYSSVYFNHSQSQNGLGAVSGGAMAGRRSIFEECGFYDRLILGGGDTFFAQAISTEKVNLKFCYSTKMLKDLEDWAWKINQKVKQSIYFTSGDLLHLWHGSSRYRSYTARYEILKRHKFNPQADIRISPDGCWEWVTNKPDLQRQVKRYFWLRNEDASFFLKIILESVKAAKKIRRLLDRVLPCLFIATQFCLRYSNKDGKKNL